MAKKSDVTLLEPPRYTRNDPRNLARVKTAHLLSMQLRGCDYPIRRLRRVGDVQVVTLPPQVRKSLALERGDWLRFGLSPWPSSAWILKVTNSEYKKLTADTSTEFKRRTRKVQGVKGNLFVTVAPAVRKILSAAVGDFLHFGLASQPGVVSIVTIKGGGESHGSRRTG